MRIKGTLCEIPVGLSQIFAKLRKYSLFQQTAKLITAAKMGEWMAWDMVNVLLVWVTMVLVDKVTMVLVDKAITKSLPC